MWKWRCCVDWWFLSDNCINKKLVFELDFCGASPHANCFCCFNIGDDARDDGDWIWTFSKLKISILINVLTNVTWLILPVVICLFQRLSHASLSLRSFERNCEWLIITVITYAKIRTTRITVVILELKREPFRRSYALDSNQVALLPLLIHNVWLIACREFAWVSDLSAFDGMVLAYHGYDG